MNAFKHGLSGQNLCLQTDDSVPYFRLALDFVEDLRPVGVREEQLAQKIIDGNWRLNRAAAIENNLLNNDTVIEAYFLTSDDERSAAIGRSSQCLACRLRRSPRARIPRPPRRPHRAHALQNDRRVRRAPSPPSQARQRRRFVRTTRKPRLEIPVDRAQSSPRRRSRARGQRRRNRNRGGNQARNAATPTNQNHFRNGFELRLALAGRRNRARAGPLTTTSYAPMPTASAWPLPRFTE